VGAEALRAWSAGEVFCVEDVETDPRLGKERAHLQAIGSAATMAYALRNNGKLVAGLSVHATRPRKWTHDNKALIRELCERTWAEIQRAYGEATLRAREARYRTLLEREHCARKAAEEATFQRDAFLSVVSHELRNPLSAIVIWSNALREGRVPPERVDSALEAIVTSTGIQHRLVEELLDMSRLSAGKLRIAVRDERLGPIVEEVVGTLAPTAQARQVELRADGIDAPISCLVDRGRLQQVLWNLVGNALKFTPAGGHVLVTLRAGAGCASIEVKDDGIGIAPGFLPYLFDRFRQASSGQARNFGGLGLGLSIARQLVEMHGGSLTAQSEGPGLGATFHLELPLGAAGVEVERDDEQNGHTSFSPWPALPGRQILLVEDESHTRAVLTWLLETCGANVIAVADGSAAREVTGLEAQFDALICDIGLPDEDGCSLLTKLRHLRSNRLPALALTAYVRPGDRERVMAAGFDVFLTKPVMPDAFIRAVAGLQTCGAGPLG
jgi:signal transduction histidine kinase/CheY-like chemotaxis protein